MLKLLHIENIAVIESCDIEFGCGFNVLTGETGAGKSIIIDASPDVTEGIEVVYDCIIPAGTPDENIAIIDCNPQQ